MSLLAVDHATPSNVRCVGYVCTDQIQYSGFQAARHITLSPTRGANNQGASSVLSYCGVLVLRH
jgi:hypothetical protein